VSDRREYNRGYRAGWIAALGPRPAPRRARTDELIRLQTQLVEAQKEKVLTHDELIYFECLKVVLTHCHDWKIGEEKVRNAELYSQLARSFAKSSIKELLRIAA